MRTIEDFNQEELDAMDAVGRRVALEAFGGNLDRACEILRAEVAACLAPDRRPILQVPLAEVIGDVRLLNLLDREFDSVTLGDALRIDSGRLANAPNFGPVSAIRLLAAVAKFAVRRCLEYESDVAIRQTTGSSH